MKNKLFLLLTFLSAGFVSVAAAENFSVSNANEFASAWAQAHDGDTITLTSGCQLPSGWTAEAKAVTIDGSGDKVLSWAKSSDGTYDVSFLSSATLQNIVIVSPAPLEVSNGYKAGANVQFLSSHGLVAGANSTAMIGEGSVFDSSAAAAINVQDGGCVVVEAGATFTKNKADGGIRLEGNTTSPAEGHYNLVVKADTGKNTLFEDNLTGGDFCDVYFGSGATALVQADGGGVVSIKSAILSDDENAGIVKTGTGTLEVLDASNYFGSLDVKGGTVSVQDNWGDGEVAVQDGAEFHLNGTFVSGNVTLNSGAKLSVATGTKATIPGAQVRAEGGTSTIELEEGAKLAFGNASLSAQSGTDVVLTNVDMSSTRMVGNNENAAIKNAAMKLAGNMQVSDLTLTETAVTVNSGKTLTLGTGSILGDGVTVTSTTTDGIVAGAVVIHIADADKFSVTGTSATLSAATLDTVVYSGNTIKVDVSYAALLALQEKGVAEVVIALLNGVTLSNETTVELGGNLVWLQTKGLDATLSSGDSFTLPAATVTTSLRLSNLNNTHVPEPATATLSLLALAALAARRRRVQRA